MSRIGERGISSGATAKSADNSSGTTTKWGSIKVQRPKKGAAFMGRADRRTKVREKHCTSSSSPNKHYQDKGTWGKQKAIEKGKIPKNGEVRTKIRS